LIIYLAQYFENCRRRPNSLANFSHATKNELILIKMGWAKFWAIFSQNHLVTLSVSHVLGTLQSM
jgi:hypothetical protein